MVGGKRCILYNLLNIHRAVTPLIQTLHFHSAKRTPTSFPRRNRVEPPQVSGLSGARRLLATCFMASSSSLVKEVWKAGSPTEKIPYGSIWIWMDINDLNGYAWIWMDMNGYGKFLTCKPPGSQIVMSTFTRISRYISLQEFRTKARHLRNMYRPKSPPFLTKCSKSLVKQTSPWWQMEQILLALLQVVVDLKIWIKAFWINKKLGIVQQICCFFVARCWPFQIS